MSYETDYIRNWLIKKDILNIAKLEKKCEMPKASLRHFIKDRRDLPEKHLASLKAIIIEYGFIEFDNE